MTGIQEEVILDSSASAETPAALLKRIEREIDAEGAGRYPSIRKSAPQYVEGFLERLGLEGEERERARAMLLDFDDGERARSLFKAVVSHLPEEHQRFLLDEQRVLPAEITTTDINAHTLRAGNGGWLILINTGLITFAYKTARALATRVRFYDPDGDGAPEADEPPPEDLDVTAQLIATPIDWYLEAGIPLGPDFPITNQQMALANDLATAAEQFVVAHELAHQLLGHVADGTRSMLVAGATVDALNVSHQQELDADALGLKLVLESITSGDQFEYAVAYAGVELFFLVVSLLEEYAAAPESATHPPAARRLESIRAALASGVEDERQRDSVAELAKLIEQLWNDVRERVLDPERHARASEAQADCDAFVRRLVRTSGPLDERVASAVQELGRVVFDYPPQVLSMALAKELRAAIDDGRGRGTDESGPYGRFMVAARLAESRWLDTAVLIRAGLEPAA
ncbi:MAG: hypothetical protein WBC33_07605 [Conexibacter sp.]